MKVIHKKTAAIVVLLSFCLAVVLGYLDRETESLVHLFTAEWGNVVALVMYTGAISTIGLVVVAALNLAKPSAP